MFVPDGWVMEDLGMQRKNTTDVWRTGWRKTKSDVGFYIDTPVTKDGKYDILLRELFNSVATQAIEAERRA